MTWAWRTTTAGFVEVDKSDGAGYVRIALPGPDRATARTETWTSLAKKYAELEGVPLPWVLAVIYSESGGDPMAGSSDDLGAGLMQLSLKYYKLTREQAQDPETSVRLGTQTLGMLRKKPQGDLPAVASMYNAGAGLTGPHPNISLPWGYRETHPSLPYSGYIEKVVAASNYWTDKLPAGVITPGGEAQQASMGSGIAVAAVGGAAAYYGARRLWDWLCGGKKKQGRS